MPGTVEVTTEIAASPEVVWRLVSDVPRLGQFSPENEGAVWLRGATGATVGATFKGSNRHESSTWSTKGRIVTAETAKRLAFRVTVGPFQVAEWRYDLEPTPMGCRVTETFIDRRNAMTKALGKRATGVVDRDAHNRASMEQTLAGLKAAAESEPAPPG